MKRKTFKKLYGTNLKGNEKYWSIKVTAESTTSTATIITKYGTKGEKERETSKLIKTGKNLGRKNETTPFEQACLEAEASWKKKLDQQGYSTTKTKSEVLLPMLAQNFTKRKRHIKYPAYGQVKLDGVRCLVKRTGEKTISYQSRLGKKFTTLSHLDDAFIGLLNIGEVWDGEIYHPDLSFQQITSLLKRQQEETLDLQFYVFDVATENVPFKQRYEEYYKRCLVSGPVNDKVIPVICHTIIDEDQVKTLHDHFVSIGFEGIIIRNMNGLYSFGHRVNDLQKYKEFETEEFIIIGGYPGTGKEDGCITFIVKDDYENTFHVKPKGTLAQRRKWMKTINKLKGKLLTVQYQNLTDDGIPRFPVGLAIRDYE